MSAQCHSPDAREVLPLEVLEDAAELRAQGRSWEATAEAVEWGARDLRRACRSDPRFAAQLELARRELLEQAEAEALHTLRELLRGDELKERAKAAEQLAKYLTARRACEARVEVEQVRAEARLAAARARARRAGGEQQREEEEEAEALTPEQERHDRERRERSAARAAEAYARGAAAVFLWGGCHRLGRTPPDATDTPLEVFEDHTLGKQPDGRRVFWAVTLPWPADPENGPFLTSPAGLRHDTGARPDA